MNITIRTRYVTRPGSNVGTYRATSGGRTFTAPPRPDLSTDEREEIAARALASILSGFDAANVRAWARSTPSPTHWDDEVLSYPRQAAISGPNPTPPAWIDVSEFDSGMRRVWSVTL